jgi:RecG-like helicase
VASVSDGGKLSEFDYARRGGGEVFGLKQSGKTAGYTAHEIALADGYARGLKQDETRLIKFREKALMDIAETLKDLTLS